MLAVRNFTSKISSLRITSRLLTTQNITPNPDLDEPTAAYYDDLVNIAGRSRDFDTVHHLLSKRYKDGCFNTTNTFKFITACEEDLSVIDELSQTLARLEIGFARKNAYDSLIARLSKLNWIDESLRVVDTMVRGGSVANACTYHPILSAVTKKKDMERAWRVMEMMRGNGVSPDVTAYNNLLTSYCFVGDTESAARVLAKMREEGMKADARTYDALVLGACKVHKVEGALAVLRRMVDDGVPLLYSTHAHVIGELLRLCYYEQAVEFVMAYGGKDKELDTQSFGILAHRLIKLKKFEKAMLVLEEMKRRDLMMGDKLRDFYERNK